MDAAGENLAGTRGALSYADALTPVPGGSGGLCSSRIG